MHYEIYMLDLQLKTDTVIFDVFTMSQQSFTLQGLLKGYSHEMDTFLEIRLINRKGIDEECVSHSSAQKL